MAERRDALRGGAVLAFAGIASAGLGWLTLIVVARTRGPGEYAGFSVVWSVYFALAGVLLGLQQETTRSMVAVRRRPRDSRLASAGSRVTLVVTVAAFALSAGAVALGLLNLDSLVGAAGPAILAIPVLAAAMMVNGALAAAGRWKLLAGLALADQIVRFGAVVLVVLVAPGQVAYGVALVAGLTCFAPLIVAGWLCQPTISGNESEFVRRSVAAMVSSGCANLLVVGLPLLITATGDESDRALGSLFAAVLLTRTPVLLVANSVRPVVVRLMVANRDVLHSGARRVAPTVAVATMAAAVLGGAVGPWLLRFMFGSGFRVSGVVMAGLVVAAVLTLLQTWTGIALTALDRDAASTAGWVLAVVVAVGCLLAPIGLEERTLAGLLVGPGLGLVAHLAAMAGAPRTASLVAQRAV